MGCGLARSLGRDGPAGRESSWRGFMSPASNSQPRRKVNKKEDSSMG